MIREKFLALALTLALLSFAPASALWAQAPADREAVQRAALDYLEGFYEGDSTKHVRSIHPNVYKIGNAPSHRITGPMTYAQFHDFSREVRTSGRKQPPGTVKEVVIYDVLDRTASAKVTAYWGIDYLLFAKLDGRWMITHVLWQGAPRPASR